MKIQDLISAWPRNGRFLSGEYLLIPQTAAIPSIQFANSYCLRPGKHGFHITDRPTFNSSVVIKTTLRRVRLLLDFNYSPTSLGWNFISLKWSRNNVINGCFTVQLCGAVRGEIHSSDALIVLVIIVDTNKRSLPTSLTPCQISIFLAREMPKFFSIVLTSIDYFVLYFCSTVGGETAYCRSISDRVINHPNSETSGCRRTTRKSSNNNR